jgi:hypothetical protein
MTSQLFTETIKWEIWDTVIFDKKISDSVLMFEVPFSINKSNIKTNMHCSKHLPDDLKFEIEKIYVKTDADIMFEFIIGFKTYLEGKFFEGITSFSILPLCIEKQQFFVGIVNSEYAGPFEVKVVLLGNLTRPIS